MPDTYVRDATASKNPTHEDQFGDETLAFMARVNAKALARKNRYPCDAFSPTRHVYADDVLSFTPSHFLAELLPLGSINRVRIKAYELLAAYRHHINTPPRIEPHDISELLD